jgi:hypothetical protein
LLHQIARSELLGLYVLVLIGESGVISSCSVVRSCSGSGEGKRKSTGNEFEGFGDIASELLGIGHLNVRHSGG